MWLQVINKVKVTHQGEGHIKVKVKISTSLQILCSPYSLQAGGLHSAEILLVFNDSNDSKCVSHSIYKFRAKIGKNVSEFTHSNWMTKSNYSSPKHKSLL